MLIVNEIVLYSTYRHFQRRLLGINVGMIVL